MKRPKKYIILVEQKNPYAKYELHKRSWLTMALMSCVALSTWRTEFKKQFLAVFQDRNCQIHTKRILQNDDILFAVLFEVTGHPDKSAISGDDKYIFDRKMLVPGAQ